MTHLSEKCPKNCKKHDLSKSESESEFFLMILINKNMTLLKEKMKTSSKVLFSRNKWKRNHSVYVEY